MAKKTKKEAVAVGSGQSAPLTWTVSDDMMSITCSDGRKGHASDSYVDCEHCMMEKICDTNPGPLTDNLMCVKSKRQGSPLSKNIIWVEDVAAVPPVALEEVPITEAAVQVGSNSGELMEIALSLIDQSPFQVRNVDVESESFKELVVSICETGLINPLTVRLVAESGRYELIAGHRRFRACEVVGKLTAACYLLQVSDRKAEDMTCCENLNREDLLPIDEALTVKAMLDHGRSREEIAKITGKSTRWVYRREAAARLEACWIEKAKRLALSSKFLEFAAALFPATRATIFNKFEPDHADLWQDGGSISMLEFHSDIAKRKLSVAPWMALFPDECNACKMRTDSCELIMDGGYESLCLDPDCWARHMRELADRAEARCREQGVAVKRVTVDEAYDMDIEDERSDEYDVCVLATDESGGLEVHWGRSTPRSEKLAKKIGSVKPTAHNLFQRAYAEFVMEMIEHKLDDFNGVLGALIISGMDLAMFHPNGCDAFPNANRARNVDQWMKGCPLTRDEAIKNAISNCVCQEVRKKLRVMIPTDTTQQFAFAQAYASAWRFDEAALEEEAAAKVKKSGKRK